MTSIKGIPVSNDKAYDKIVKTMGEIIDFGSSVKVGLAHADAPEKAAALKPRIQEQYDCVEFYETYMGCAVGATVGPGSIGIEYYLA